MGNTNSKQLHTPPANYHLSQLLNENHAQMPIYYYINEKILENFQGEKSGKWTIGRKKWRDRKNRIRQKNKKENRKRESHDGPEIPDRK